MKKLKKIFVSFLIFIVVLVGALFAIPIFFKDQIKAKIQQTINENVDAKVSFADADLSLFKSFPNATVSLNKFLVINKAPFAGDTLVSFEDLNLKMSVKELFKSENETIKIDGIYSKNGLINIIFNQEGIGNFDIALKDQKKEDASKSKPFALNIQNYAVDNFRFKYYDEKSKIKMVLDSLNHEGTGNFASENLDLKTKSTAKVSIDMDKINYMKNVAITLDAVLGIDIKNKKYTFKENNALINQLPLKFNGDIQLLENGQNYNLSFKTPSSSFKNFLGLVPSAYSGNLNTVKTSGDFSVNGKVNGLFSDTSVPKFNIAIASNNASFQYPNLPKSVQDIIIDTKIINETGIMNDTYVNLDQLSFRIDKDVFNAKANIKNIAVNALVDAQLKGTINLDNFTKAYPVKLDKPLSGILNADVVTKFDMKSVENSQYQNIQNAGNMTLTGFNYSGDGMAKPVQISKAVIAFNPNQIRLNQFNATTGKSDIQLSGTLDNFYGFVFRNQILKGNFDMKSNQFLIADFMTPSKQTTATETNSKKEAVKIPPFLDCAVTATANMVVYDNLTLKDVTGKMIIRDETVTLQNVKTNIFDGQINMNGVVSTKGKIPTFNMDMALNKVDINQSFSQLAMLKKIAPIAGIINGKLNSNIKLSGNLNEGSFTPDLKTLSGDLLGQMLSSTVNSSNSTLLTALSSNLKFIDLNKLNLNDIKAALTFKDGKVAVKPFDIKYQDIKATIGGSHGFDQNMNYNVKFDVPAKYLGAEVNALLAKIPATDLAKLQSIPVTAMLSGNFTSPKISTDMKGAVTNLTAQLVKQQKDKLIQKGTSALEDLINKNKKPGDTTKTVIPTTKEEIKEKAKEEIKTQVETKAKDLLKGIFGN